MAVSYVIVIVVIVVLVALAIALTMRQRAQRKQVGPEYDRLVREMGPRRAKSEFAKRRQHVAELDIKPLSAERRTAYDTQWLSAQERFIDSPLEAVRSAAGLVTAVASDRGYPVDDDSQLLTDLSVNYGGQLDGYRRARRITEQAEVAETEQLRQALLDHRAMFIELLGPADDGPESTRTSQKLVAARPDSER
jgi:hypothetical protein